MTVTLLQTHEMLYPICDKHVLLWCTSSLKHTPSLLSAQSVGNSRMCTQHFNTENTTAGAQCILLTELAEVSTKPFRALAGVVLTGAPIQAEVTTTLDTQLLISRFRVAGINVNKNL